jgi:hypothetical protein
MHPLEHAAAALVALLFFGLALSLILDATGRKPKNHLENAGGPWAWIGAFTICGALGAAKALGA